MRLLTTYEKRAKIEASQSMLSKMITRKFGEGTTPVLKQIESIENIEKLESLVDKLWDAETIDDFSKAI